MMILVVRRSLMILLALSVGACALAQLGRGTMTVNSVMLLGSKSVRAEVGLRGDADKQVEKAFQNYATEATKLLEAYNKNRSRRDELNAILKKHQQKLIDLCLRLMTPPMEARLRQLGIQRYGPFSINSPDMIKELKLTPAQQKYVKAQVDGHNALLKRIEDRRKKTINAVRDNPPKNRNDKKAMEAYRKRLEAAVKKNFEQDLETLRKSQEAAEKRILANLTANQRKQYEAMKGRKFDFSRG